MNQQGSIRVGDIMVSNLRSVDGLDTVARAMALMREHGVNALAVNRRNDDDEVGLVSVTDIAREVVAQSRAPERVNVYEIMSKPVITLPPEMLARYAVRLLVRFGISRALVVDQHRNPVGIATLRDLVLGEGR